MRRVWIFFVLTALLIAACAAGAAPTQEPEDVGNAPTATSAPEDAEPDLGPAEESVIQQLAQNLGLEEGDISLVSSEETEFADACLGVALEGVMCAEVITPGRTIVLEADSVEYEYHVSEDGSRVQPASLALIWKREGGIAGFCDTLTVFRSGEVYTGNCKSQAEGAMGIASELMTAKELRQFTAWMAEFGDVELDASDPKGVADRMVVTIEMFGTGDGEPSPAEEQVLFEFAQAIYQEMTR